MFTVIVFEILLLVTGSKRVKDLLPYLKISIFGMWSCSSLLVLHGLTDMIFWENLSNYFGRLPLLKKQISLKI